MDGSDGLRTARQYSVLHQAVQTYCVSIGPEDAMFSREHGCQADVHVPLYVLRRSAQLRDTLTTAEEDGASIFPISLPAGVLQGWLNSLHELCVLRDDVFASAERYKHKGFIERYNGYLKAADFLNDEDCLNRLIAKVADYVFPSSETPDLRFTDVEALTELHEDLLLRILKACKQPWFKHLEVLPQELHIAALHACCPSISASSSLHVRHIKSREQVDALAPLLAQLPSIKSMSVSGSSHGVHCYGDELPVQAQGLTQLQELCLHRIFLGVKGSAALANNLQGLSGLKELKVTETFIDPDYKQVVMGQISSLKGLRVLDLQGMVLGVESIRALVVTFRQLQKLRKLCLASNNLRNRGFEVLAPKLPLLKRLEDLDLSHNGCTPPVPVLPALPSLLQLNLEQIYSFPRRLSTGLDYGSLLRGIQRFTALESLNLSSSSLVGIGVIGSIGELCALRTLLLRDCHIQSIDHKVGLLETLPKLHRLEMLDIGNNMLYTDTSSTVVVMESIADLQNLTWLGLSHVADKLCSVSGLAAALSKLQCFQNLSHLDVSGNTFSVPGNEAESVAEAVCGFTSLRSLNISYSNLLVQGLHAWLQGTNLYNLDRFELGGTVGYDFLGKDFLLHVRDMSNLQRLSLGDNTIGVSAQESLMQCLPGLPYLSYLELVNCKLRDAEALFLAPTIQKLGALRELDVRQNSINDVGWNALLPALDRRPDVFCLHADRSYEDFALSCTQAMYHVEVNSRLRRDGGQLDLFGV